MEGENSEGKCKPKWQIARDIMFNIHSRLPVKSLIRFSCASKFWLEMIKDPEFRHLHSSQFAADPMLLLLSHQTMKESILSLNLMEVQSTAIQVSRRPLTHMVSSQTWNLVGTCNGLLCFTFGDHQEHIVVCNPITREQVTLPKPPTITCDSCKLIFGFGFDPLGKEYKVVCICYHEDCRLLNDDCHATAMVYTLGVASSWRSLGVFQHHPSGKPIYANGAVHWLIHPTSAVQPNHNRLQALLNRFPDYPDRVPTRSVPRNRILSFSLNREEFTEISHPSFGPDCNLSELGGRLSAVDLSSGGLVEVWLQNDPIGNQWTRQYIIPVKRVKRPRSHINSPKLTCVHEHNGTLLIWLGDSLVSYEQKSFRRRNLVVRGLLDWFSWEICSGFRGSLVQPKGCHSDRNDLTGNGTYFMSDNMLYSEPISGEVVVMEMGESSASPHAL